jgi:polyferredoxin
VSTLAFRFGRRIGWLLQFYPARLAVNLAYKALMLLILAIFPAAPIAWVLSKAGIDPFLSAIFGGAIAVIVALSADKSGEAFQVLTGWPRRRR